MSFVIVKFCEPCVHSLEWSEANCSSNSVDRLIKASKASQKNARRSIISNGSPTNSVLFHASGSSSALEQLSFSNSKLNLAQTELQACEAHLAERERALSNLRETALVRGLKGRCQAIVQCGWAWAEMGKEGVRALEALGDGSAAPNGFREFSSTELLLSLESISVL